MKYPFYLRAIHIHSTHICIYTAWAETSWVLIRCQQIAQKLWTLCSRSLEYEDYYLLKYDVIQSGRNSQMFRGNILALSSWRRLKNLCLRNIFWYWLLRYSLFLSSDRDGIVLLSSRISSLSWKPNLWIWWSWTFSIFHYWSYRVKFNFESFVRPYYWQLGSVILKM
jgi:hypothetical protein